MYDDCNVAYKGSAIPVIMQDLRRSKEHIDRGAVSSQNNYTYLILSVYSQGARTKSALPSRCLLIGKKKLLLTRKPTVGCHK